MRARNVVLVACFLVGCGGASGPSFAMPATRLADEKTRSAPTIACSEQRTYDVERGCSTPSWGVPVSIEHRNDIGGGFRLVGAAFALDGELVFDTNDPRLLEKRSFPVSSTNVRSGEHELRVLLVYRGHGYGVFAYLSGYRFESTKAHVFRAQARDVRLRSIGFERSDVPLEQRPSIRFQSW